MKELEEERGERGKEAKGLEEKIVRRGKRGRDAEG
jgi:hypothetical protein